MLIEPPLTIGILIQSLIHDILLKLVIFIRKEKQVGGRGNIGSLKRSFKILIPAIIIGTTVLIAIVLATAIVLIQPRPVYTLYFWHSFMLGGNTVDSYAPQLAA